MRILAEYYPENDYLLLSTSQGNKNLYSSLMEHRNIKLQTPESQIAQLLRGLWRNFGLKKILKEEDIDIYHGLSNEIPMGLYNNQQLRTIVTIHDLAFIRYPEFY
ncbi:MAG: mannosyltransferase, partial [Bacteroidia bacterium]